MNPVKVSLRYPTVTLILAFMVVSVGIQAFLKMPRMEDPSITVRTGLVLALYPGATSEQVEKQVTKKIEDRIFKFPEIRKEKTFSTSRHGMAVINVELEDNVKDSDVFWSKLRHEMNELSATELPQGVRGPIVNSDFGDTIAMLVAVHGKRYGYRELRDYVNRIQDEMRTVRDVAKLKVYGDQDEQIWITSSLERMSQYFADPLRVIQSLQQSNVVLSSGSFETSAGKVPLRTTGLFTSEEQIRKVMVDVSRTGQPVYIGDFANVERRYKDPSFLVRYDGESSLLLSVEMQKGKNIVEMGQKVQAVLDRLQPLLPPDLKLDLIADQPSVVKSRIGSLTHEFLLAIGAVILVTLILLPFRVAIIAAFAIPVTIFTTLGVMNAIGLQLHQVSIAALIVVLGIVVDDAIVIADNFVELLDHKVPHEEAAWRCATDVAVPVLTATLTIIASFVPLLILSGSAGEFIRALPIAVAVALSVSFIVAVLLTPLLCRFFIKKGLHDHSAGETTKKSFNLLDLLQTYYGKTIAFFMGHKPLAIALGVLSLVAGLLLFKLVPQQFFPSAERNQFVVDVLMPQGSRVEATDAVMRSIENELKQEKLVAHYASFVGQSAPRFYYNVNPQQPDPAYGQFIVNTKFEEETPALVNELRQRYAKLAPEAMVIVKELQQGSLMEAPVEVRISGDDIVELKRLGKQVENMFRASPISQFVYTDYQNDSYMVDVNVNNEVANRLGISNASVSRILSGAFDGVPVSTYWEGERQVNIVLRLEPGRRAAFENVSGAYITSQITHASVPLRSFAGLQPEWETSRIVRRNGVRTLTVRSFFKPGYYGSELLNAIDPQIKAMGLPARYRIEYGGEYFNQHETFPQMVTALGISLIAIFLILLIQFRNISQPLVIMTSIPLSLFGAIFGLVITRNPFGFTAFMGLISLCGIVVRNAIILVDYINEKIREGSGLEQAAREAGERRLRPIFLTTMAAAVGVTPMILSGSSLWSPLASVIAIGLIFSMFFTLLVVPIIFVLVEGRTKRPAIAASLVFAILFGGTAANAEVRKLTLPEAVHLALKQNSLLKIARLKARENNSKVVSARANYFPQLSSDATLMGLSEQQSITIPAGSLGTIPNLGSVPNHPVLINQGKSDLFFTNTTLGQPLTQFFKIREGARVARADLRISEIDVKKAENEIALKVHELYYGLLIIRKQKEAAASQVSFAEERMRDSESGVRSGNILDVAVLGSRAGLLESRHSLLSAEDQIEDLSAELDDLLGLPIGTELKLADVPLTPTSVASREEYLRIGLAENSDVRAAAETVAKARSGIAAARAEYIPEVSAFARYTYQNGVPFVMHNLGTFGLQMNWNIFDGGKRRGVVGQREAQLAQAEENLQRLRNRMTVDVDKAYRKLQRAKKMVDVAREALALRKENVRLTANQFVAGVATEMKSKEMQAAAAKSEAEYLQASLAYSLAQAELERTVGRTAR